MKQDQRLSRGRFMIAAAAATGYALEEAVRPAKARATALRPFSPKDFNYPILVGAGAHLIGLTENGVSQSQPLIVFKNQDETGQIEGKFSLGLDVAQNPPNNSFFIAAVNADQRSVSDILFIDRNTYAVGLNFAPPPRCSLAVSGFDSEPDRPAVIVRVARGQQAEALKIVGATSGDLGAITADGTLTFRRITGLNGGEVAARGMRIESTDPARPTGLFINAKVTNSGPDFQIRARDDPNSTFLEIGDRSLTTGSPPFLTIRRRDGRVGIGGISDMSSLLDVNGDSIRIRSSRTPPAANSQGDRGTIAWDANFVYVCVAPNTWKRAALTSW